MKTTLKIEIYHNSYSIVSNWKWFNFLKICITVSELEEFWRDTMLYNFEIGLGNRRDVFETEALNLENLN